MVSTSFNKDALKQAATTILQTQGMEDAARFLAQTLFAGRVDKGGHPYIGHLERVARGIDDSALRPAGWLHDLLEDIGGWVADDLRDIGFNDYIVDAVVAVSKAGEDAPYFDEMVKVGMTPQAIRLKKSDLVDNSNYLRLPGLPSYEDIEQKSKYYLSYHYLDDVQHGVVAPGTPFAVWMMKQPPTMHDWNLLRKHSRVEIVPVLPTGVVTASAAAPGQSPSP